jgi:hypothetical protein
MDLASQCGCTLLTGTKWDSGGDAGGQGRGAFGGSSVAAGPRTVQCGCEKVQWRGSVMLPGHALSTVQMVRAQRA